MVHLTALVGFLAYGFLPGIALVSWKKRERDYLETLGMACAISVGINSFAVMLLALTNLYRPWSAWTWTGLLIAATAVIFSKRPWQNHAVSHEGSAEPPEKSKAGGSAGNRARWLGRVSTSRASRIPWLLLPIFTIQAYRASFFPFVAYDAVASWNRWARDYVLDPQYILHEKHFYTHYMSWGMSFPYMLGGDTGLEYYSHALSFLHVLILYAGIMGLARVLGGSGRLAFAVLLMTAPFYRYASTGYADAAASAFAVLSAALFAKALKNFREQPWMPWMAGLAGGTAFLFKQSALLVVVLVPLLAFLVLRQREWRTRFQIGLRTAAAMAAVVVPWYLIGQNPFFGSQFNYVVKGIHGGLGQADIFLKGAAEFVSSASAFTRARTDWMTVGLFAIGTGLACFRNRVAAVVALAGLGNVLVWMNTANYDARGMMPGLALLVVVAVCGLQRAGTAVPHEAVRNLASAGLILTLMFFYVKVETHQSWYSPGKIDWRDSGPWYSVRPFAGRTDKLRIVQPKLADLEDWKSAHPGFSGRVWGDALTMAALDPHRSTRHQHWVEFLPGGKPDWRIGEHVLVSEDWLQSAKTPSAPWETASGNVVRSWGEWIRHYVDKGVLRAAGVYGRLSDFEVVQPIED